MFCVLKFPTDKRRHFFFINLQIKENEFSENQTVVMAQSLFQMMQSGPRRKRSDAVLKTYESAIDVRAFSPDPVERSKFIEEVVKGRPGRSYCDKNEGTSAPPGDDPCALRKMKMELKVIL